METYLPPVIAIKIREIYDRTYWQANEKTEVKFDAKTTYITAKNGDTGTIYFTAEESNNKRKIILNGSDYTGVKEV
jgi:hypothetical protein